MRSFCRILTGEELMDMKFSEQYKHPLWQKLRLEVLNDAEWKCSSCSCSDQQLHVHHLRYVKGRKIWEYEKRELMALCAECHEARHSMKDAFSALLVAAEGANIPCEELLSLLAGYVYAYAGDCPEVHQSLDAGAETVASFYCGEVGAYAFMNLTYRDLCKWRVDQITQIAPNVTIISP